MARAKLHCFSNEYTIANVAKHARKICGGMAKFIMREYTDF